MHGRLTAELSLSALAAMWRVALPSSHWLMRELKRNVHRLSCAELSDGERAKSTIALPSPLRHGCTAKE